MKTGFKCILAALAMLFGFALLSASVQAQTCTPEKAAIHGFTVNTDGSHARIDDDAEKDCDKPPSGDGNFDTDDGKKCDHMKPNSLDRIKDKIEAEEKGECDTEKAEKADYDLLIVKGAPMAANTFVLTWKSATGSVSHHVSGTMLTGYVTAP